MSKPIAIVAAAAAGVIAGILYAPKSGKETRNDIKDKSREAKKIADQKVNQVKTTVAKGRSKVAEHTKKSAKTDTK